MIIECTKDKPWDGKTDPGDRVRHREASEEGDHSDEGYAVYVCKVCGHRWKEELPQ